METLKTSRGFRGPLISFRGLCLLEDRSPPFSLFEVVIAREFRHFNGQISSGDVDCTWHMFLWRNGFWSVQADFHDGGTVAGDFFFADFLLDTDHSVGAKLEGSILNIFDNRHLLLNKDGSDNWIRENWHKFEHSGPTVRLHAAPAIGELVASPVVALAAVPSVVFVIAGAVIVGGILVLSPGAHRGTMKRCPQGTVNLGDPPIGNNPCVEIIGLPDANEPH